MLGAAERVELVVVALAHAQEALPRVKEVARDALVALLVRQLRGAGRGS
jgi:hypothetical protein